MIQFVLKVVYMSLKVLYLYRIKLTGYRVMALEFHFETLKGL